MLFSTSSFGAIVVSNTAGLGKTYSDSALIGDINFAGIGFTFKTKPYYLELSYDLGIEHYLKNRPSVLLTFSFFDSWQGISNSDLVYRRQNAYLIGFGKRYEKNSWYAKGKVEFGYVSLLSNSVITSDVPYPVLFEKTNSIGTRPHLEIGRSFSLIEVGVSTNSIIAYGDKKIVADNNGERKIYHRRHLTIDIYPNLNIRFRL